jgi:tetratricopeptide (TPR) repeat protein
MIRKYRLQILTLLMKASAAAALLLFLFTHQTFAGKPSADEYEAFGRRLVSLIESGDEEALRQSVDVETMVDRVLEGLSEDRKLDKELRDGLHAAMSSLPGKLIGNMKDRAVLTFVRSRKVEGQQRALVRIDLGDEGLNYMEFVLHKGETGSIKMVDLYDFANGQLFTLSMKQIIAMALPEERNLLERLLGVNRLSEKEQQFFLEQGKLLQEKKFEEWLEKYELLPVKIKSSRVFLVTRAMLSGTTGDNEKYLNALGDLHRHFGDDPTLSLVLLDYYLLTKDFKAAHAALENLERYTGGDAAITALSANVYLMEKDYPEAISHARKVIKQEPTYEDAYWTLLDANVFSGNYSDAVKVLGQLEKNFGYSIDPETLAGIEGYEEFAGSEAFSGWKKEE